MKNKLLCKIVAGVLATATFPFSALAADKVDKDTVEELTADWPNRPKLALAQMIQKYGIPQEAGVHTIIWHNAGPFKRIILNNVETSHSFPKPHVDFLQHTVTMKVPADKANDLVAFDGSNTFSRTEGEISARCDSEAHNILTLNLINDILVGTKTVAQAREAFDQNVADDLAGKNPPYMAQLQFDPVAKAGRDPDVVTLPGASQPMTTDGEAQGDAEILCVLAALDENEILAAEEVEKRKITGPAMDYAKTMHKEHGMNIDMVMKLGQKLGTPPKETARTDKLRVKGAGELAMLIKAEGNDPEDFGKAYITAMIKDHTEVLSIIDDDLMKSVQKAEVKQFLTETRGHIQMHLDMAKGIKDKM